MDYDWLVKELHSRARAVHESLVDFGHVFDKKMLRFNDVVEACLRYADCGLDDIKFDTYCDRAFSALPEVLASCIKELSPIWSVDKAPHSMYVPGRGPLTITYEWMRNPVLVEARKIKEEA